MKSTNKRERDGFYLFKALLIVFVLALLSACSPKYIFIPGNIINPHTHTYSDEWFYDETGHWHNATCGHDVEKDYAQHTFEERIDATTGTVMTYKYCTVCGYETEPAATGETVYQATLDGKSYSTIQEAVEAWNTGNDERNDTIILQNGKYVLDNLTIKQTAEGKGLTIEAETAGGVLLSAGEQGSTEHTNETWGIFKIESDSSYNGSTPITFKNLTFELLNSDGGNVCAVHVGTTGSDRYTENIIIDGCSFYGINDESYAVSGTAGSGNKNVTFQNCYAENMRGFYQGIATPVKILDSTFKDCKSIINRQNKITPATDDSYNIEIRNVSGNVKSAIPDSIYAIRSSGGRMLIENCNITMDFNTDGAADTGANGLIVLRDGTHEVDIKNSVLTVNNTGAMDNAYIIYQETGKKEPENINSIIITGTTLNGKIDPALNEKINIKNEVIIQ